jgi:hypothetical protein
MKKQKRLAILTFLLFLSVCSAIIVHAARILPNNNNIEETKLNIQSSSVSLILSSQEKDEAIKLAIEHPQIHPLLETAQNYTANTSEIFDLIETSEGINLVPKPGVAQVSIEINNDYGQEFGQQKAIATVDLEQKKITSVDIQPEVIRLKINNETITTTEIVENAAKYEGVIVTTSGKVSLLGEVFGSLFKLNQEITVFYVHEEATIDVTQIQNGDTVMVTGKFVAPQTIYALSIEKT